MVAFAEIDKFEAPSSSAPFGSAVAVAVEDDGAPLSASMVGRSKQGRGSFTGYVADNETGLSCARTRMYSPTLGAFISRDKAYQRNGRPLPGDGYPDGFSFYNASFIPNGLDAFGYWNDDGHQSFPNLQNPDGSWEFDYTLEDHDPNTEPLFGNMEHHFRSRETVEGLLAGDVDSCDFTSLERHMHQLQDVPVHHDKGYRPGYAPWRLGHAYASVWAALGIEGDPDHPGGDNWRDSPEYGRATSDTTDWLTKFLEHCCKKSGKWVVKANEPCCDKDQPTIGSPTPGNLPPGKAGWKTIPNPRLPNRQGHGYVVPTYVGPLAPNAR